MPALNAARFIEAALRSLLREKDTVPLDIIVIDDGSTDDTTQAPAAGTPTRILRGPYLQSSMYRAEAIRALGLFDEQWRQSDDLEFVLRAIDYPLRLHLEDALAAYYRRHDANVTLDMAEVNREFRLVTMKWAVRRSMQGKGPPPAIFSELFASPRTLEKEFS
ncbi:MAG: glycosyltransferase [Planctomycetota bacterium]